MFCATLRFSVLLNQSRNGRNLLCGRFHRFSVREPVYRAMLSLASDIMVFYESIVLVKQKCYYLIENDSQLHKS